MNEEQLQEIVTRRALVGAMTMEHDGDYLDGVRADYEIVNDTNFAVAWVRDGENLATFIVRAPDDVDALIAEVRSLRAKLAAVPVAALRFCVDAADYTYDAVVDVADEWLKTLEVQP